MTLTDDVVVYSVERQIVQYIELEQEIGQRQTTNITQHVTCPKTGVKQMFCPTFIYN